MGKWRWLFSFNVTPRCWEFGICLYLGCGDPAEWAICLDVGQFGWTAGIWDASHTMRFG